MIISHILEYFKRSLVPSNITPTKGTSHGNSTATENTLLSRYEKPYNCNGIIRLLSWNTVSLIDRTITFNVDWRWRWYVENQNDYVKSGQEGV